MSNPFYSGLEGSLWALDGTEWLKVAAVKSWGFSQSQAVLETTTLGDTDRTIVDGVRSLSGSCSLHYKAPDGDRTASCTTPLLMA